MDRFHASGGASAWRGAARHLCVALGLALAGCETPPSATQPGPPERPVPAPAARAAPRPPAPAPAPAEARWQFVNTGAECRATAIAAPLRLSIRVGNGVVELTLSGAPRAASRNGSLGFVGELGSWSLASRPGAGMTWTEPLTDEAAARLVGLLSGGLVSLSGSPQTRLQIPPAGQAGQAWFGCVRRQLVI